MWKTQWTWSVITHLCKCEEAGNSMAEVKCGTVRIDVSVQYIQSCSELIKQQAQLRSSTLQITTSS